MNDINTDIYIDQWLYIIDRYIINNKVFENIDKSTWKVINTYR